VELFFDLLTWPTGLAAVRPPASADLAGLTAIA
jgi:hypothetical protein